MRVLHVSDRWSLRGGADWHLRCVLRALVQSGVEVHLAIGRDEAPEPAPCPVTQVEGLDAPGASADLRERLEALARSVGPDLVHTHNALSPEALTWAADVGGLMTVQDHRTFCPGRGKLTRSDEVCRTPLGRHACAGCFDDDAYADRLLRRTRARLDQVERMRSVVVLSRYMREELVTAGVDRTRIRVIPPFVTGLTPAEPTGPPCVLVAGRLVDAKGLEDAIAVWRASEVELPLVFAGTGSARARLERAGFEVLGWIPHEELSGVYARARALLLLPRWQEPFGIAGLEARSLGVPVVAWDSGGIREWWPAAARIPWGDRTAAARALRIAVQGAAPPRSRELAPDDALGILLDLYQELRAA